MSRKTFCKPPRLELGDTVQVISPASPPQGDTVIDAAAEWLKSQGYSVVIGKNARLKRGFIAGGDRERLSDLHAAFRNKKVKAILCTRGGYGTGRILNSVDYRLIAHNPKIIVGCSDITALHCALLTRSRLVTFHGPMANGIVLDGFPSFTTASLFRAVGAASANAPFSISEGYGENTRIVIRKGRATGPLVGGNLAMLCSLLGTSFFPTTRGTILFLEEIGESPYRIDRMLTQLLNAGALDDVAGIALGLFKNCEYKPIPENAGMQTLRQVIEERLLKLRVPIVFGLPFGHTAENATLPYGVRATLDGSRDGDLVIEEAPVTA